MKAIKKWRIMAFGIMLLLVAGCATTGTVSQSQAIINSTYSGLKVFADSYNVAKTVWLSPTVQAQLSDDQKIAGYKASLAFNAAYQAAVQALYAYSNISSADNDTKLATAMNQIGAALQKFIVLAQPFMPKGGIQ